MYYLILKSGKYAEGDFKPEGSTEVSRRPPRLETTWDGSTWVETDDSKAQAYARNRQEEYPSIADLVVALYDTDDKSAVEAKRAAVKAKYPKPS